MKAAVRPHACRGLIDASFSVQRTEVLAGGLAFGVQSAW